MKFMCTDGEAVERAGACSEGRKDNRVCQLRPEARVLRMQRVTLAHQHCDYPHLRSPPHPARGQPDVQGCLLTGSNVSGSAFRLRIFDRLVPTLRGRSRREADDYGSRPWTSQLGGSRTLFDDTRRRKVLAEADISARMTLGGLHEDRMFVWPCARPDYK